MKVTVFCRDCPRTVKGAVRRWLWFCRDCADECLTAHKTNYGHHDMNMVVDEEPSIESVQTLIRSAPVSIFKGDYA